jgi:TonB family protein
MMERSMFLPLDSPQSRTKSFAAGWGVQLILIAAVLGFNAMFPKALPQVSRYVAINLLAPTPVPVSQTPQPHTRIKPIPPPPTQVQTITLPPVRREERQTLPDPPTVVVAENKMPNIVAPTVKPLLNNFSTGSSATPTTPRPAIQVQTGGFGDPNGVAPDPNAKRSANIAAVGSFDLPEGSGHGNGLGGKIPGVVVSTGFGNGTATGNGHPNVAVTSSNFDKHVVEEKDKGTKVVAASPTQPVEITFKPQPKYTEEGIRAKVEGIVKLQVKMTADGKVEILNVLSTLGYGLDEQAIRAAQQIKFKPAQTNGKDVDATVVVSIIFELAS